MKNFNVLIVEDDRVCARLLQKMIDEKPGYSCVAVVDNGVDAINQIYKGKLDLILMDIGLLGVMNGRDAARVILDNYNIPSIFVSGQPFEETISISQESYSYGYVMKPFTKESLFEQIESGLEKFLKGDKIFPITNSESSELDELTGVLTIGSLLIEMAQKNLLEDTRLGVLIIRLDGFKDSQLAVRTSKYEYFIQAMVICIINNLENSKLVARYNEESIIVLVPNSNITELENIQSAILLSYNKYVPDQTVSVGYSINSKLMRSKNELFDEAENKMKYMKFLREKANSFA